MKQQPAFDRGAKREAGQRTIGPDDAMTGDDDAKRIGGIGLAHGPGGTRPKQFGGESAVGRRSPLGNPLQGGPYLFLKGGTQWRQPQVETPAPTGEILQDLLADLSGMPLIFS